MAKLEQRRWKRLVLRTVLVTVVLAIAGLSVTLGMRRSAQKRIAEATKVAVPPGIDSLERVRLGGITPMSNWLLGCPNPRAILKGLQAHHEWIMASAK